MDKAMLLPIELVLNVITCSLPPPNVILDPSHPTTKTLISFTQVCHETRRLATRYLRQHCVYLDSPRRLRSFLLKIPTRPELRKITCLSLAPFADDIDDLPLCAWVRELLNYTCDTLRKLIVDIPFRTCYPEDDHLAVRPVLREGFERLVNLEEFVSTRDELYLDVTAFEHAVIWKNWPKLKRLALYNVDANENFWRHVATHPSLETLVLSNPDGVGYVDPKSEYLKCTDRPLKVIICRGRGRYMSWSPEYSRDTDWEKLDPESKMTIIAPLLPEVGEDHLLDPLQEMIRAAAEDGTLWEWEGEIIRRSAQMSLVI